MWTWAESNRRPNNPYYKDNVCLIFITSASEFWHIDSFNRLIQKPDSIAVKESVYLKLYITNYQTLRLDAFKPRADRSHPLHHFIYVEERVALLGKTLASLLYTFCGESQLY
mgnify:CR=1 FL=1